MLRLMDSVGGEHDGSAVEVRIECSVLVFVYTQERLNLKLMPRAKQWSIDLTPLA